MVDVARRLCSDNGVVVNEIWTYHGVGDDVRFTLVHRTKDSHSPSRASGQAAKKTASVKRPAPKTSAGSRKQPQAKAAKLSRHSKSSRPSKTVKAAKTARKPVRGQKRR
jgi:hypothetical protein